MSDKARAEYCAAELDGELEHLVRLLSEARLPNKRAQLALLREARRHVTKARQLLAEMDSSPTLTHKNAKKET